MIRVFLVSLLVFVSAPVAFAGTAADVHAQYMSALDRMMVELGAQTSRASSSIKREYRAYLDLLVLDEYTAIEDALATGGLVPLPAPERFNIKPRTDGPAPIAEKDLDNQATYISARPATIGALLDIASRVKTGQVEITSLVRHSEYQDALRTTNSNANTSIPMHTMGLAVDIALINTPIKTVYEIRDVLQQMQAAGDILVIGERKQLVFHVVPHPSRMGYYTDLYTRAMTSSALPSAPMNRVLTPYAEAVVSTAVAGIRPTDDHAAEWWAAGGADSHLTVAVSPAAPSMASDDRWLLTRVAARAAALVSGFFHAAKDLVS